MSAPTLDRHPGSSQTGSSEGRRRRRKQLVLVTSALIVLALAVGTALALATRPVARQATAVNAPVAVAEDQNTNADQEQPQAPEQGTTSNAGNSGTSGETGAKDPGTGATAQVLPEGRTPAYITKVDAANNRIVVDVVQVFEDDQAVKAAIADGKPPEQAKYYTGWIRNENSRLRTLPLAGNLDVKLMGSCEDTDDRAAVLARLADHAKRKGGYYFVLTVADGKVTKIQERMVINAC